MELTALYIEGLLRSKKMKIGNKTRDSLFPFTYLIILAGIIGLGSSKLNSYFNNKEITNPKYHMVSYSRGINGHVEYVKYSNGSQDVKIYPNFGLTLFGF